MKKLKIKGCDFAFYKLNNDDIEYLESSKGQIIDKIYRKFIYSNESESRFDHMMYDLTGIEKNIGVLANLKKTLYQMTLSEALNTAFNELILQYKRELLHDDTILLNSQLAIYKPLEEFTILEEDEFNLESFLFKTYDIVENSKYLVLENSSNLAKTTYKLLEGEKFSYINNLYSYLDDDNGYKFKYIVKKFIEVGGNTIFVYTSARNVTQMYVYTIKAHEAGINNFIIKVSNNTSNKEDINKYVKQMNKLGINVDLEYLKG